MYTRKIEDATDCGLYLAMRAMGGKWKCCILDAISKGHTRPSDMVRYITVASTRVIEMQLAELLFYGLVEKNAEDVYPKKTEYKLTCLGETLLPILATLDQWGTEHAHLINERTKELDHEQEAR